MRIHRPNTPPSAIGMAASPAANASTKTALIKVDQQAAVQAAVMGRPSRPSPLQRREAGIQSVANLTRQLGIDLRGRAVPLRPAQPTPNH